MSLSDGRPRLLLVEDDAVSRAFLVDALLALPATVDAADSIAAARRWVAREVHDLWLVDAGLPDGDGIDCLSALREQRPEVPALAVTAEAFEDRRQSLSAAGFVEVLQKPIAIVALQAAVRRILDPASADESGPHPSLWDQTQALAAAGGRKETVLALRRLFLEELPRQRGEIVEATVHSDAGAARAILHKLKASCGFVGAHRLLAAVRALSDRPLDPEAMRCFGRCVDSQLSENAPEFQSSEFQSAGKGA
jgi:DNA-binding response OmpR family regulator